MFDLIVKKEKQASSLYNYGNMFNMFFYITVIIK